MALVTSESERIIGVSTQPQRALHLVQLLPVLYERWQARQRPLPPDLAWARARYKAHDQRFWPKILKAVPEGALLLLDLGFTNSKVFAQMTKVTFITRAKRTLTCNQ
jgi:hypothetical protein